MTPHVLPRSGGRLFARIPHTLAPFQVTNEPWTEPQDGAVSDGGAAVGAPVSTLPDGGDLDAASADAGSAVLFSTDVDAGPPIIIWPLGDSITYGTEATGASEGGWRLPLYKALISKKYLFAFEGSVVDAFPPKLKHDGHPGYTIENLLTEAKGVYPGHVARADLVTLFAGTNNCDGVVAYDGAQAEADYRELLGYVAGLTRRYVLVTTIPPIYEAQEDANVLDLNPRLRAEWDYYDAHRLPSDPGLIRADVFAAMGGKWDERYIGSTNVHPTPAGYTQIIEPEFERAMRAAGAIH